MEPVRVSYQRAFLFLAMIQVFGRIIYRAFNLHCEVFTRFDIREVVRIPDLDTLRECGRDGERGES